MKKSSPKALSTRYQFLNTSNLTPASTFIKQEFIDTLHSIEYVLIDESCRLDSIVAALLYAITRRLFLIQQKKPLCEVLIVVPRTKESFNFCHQALVLIVAFQADDISVDDLFAFNDTHPELIYPKDNSTFSAFYTYINYNLHIHAKTVRNSGFVIGFDRGGIIEADRASPKKRKNKMPTLPKNQSISTLTTQTLLNSFTLRNINIAEFVNKCVTLTAKQKQEDFYRLYNSFSIAALTYHYLQDKFPEFVQLALRTSNHVPCMLLCAIQCETRKFRRLFPNDYYVATKMKNELPLADVFQMNGYYKTTISMCKMIFKPEFYQDFMNSQQQQSKKKLPKIPEEEEFKVKPSGYGIDDDEDEEEDNKRQFKWLQSSLITQTLDTQAHGTRFTGWNDPTFYITSALTSHLQTIATYDMQISFAHMEYNASARSCIAATAGFSKIYAVVWDYNSEKELMNYRVIQLKFATSEYASDFSKDLANDVHVGANGAFSSEICEDKSVMTTIYQRTKPKYSWMSAEICIDTLINIYKRVHEKKQSDSKWLERVFK